MVDVSGKIKELEDQLRDAQYNKATEHHFGVVKAQIAKLREKIEKQASKKGYRSIRSGIASLPTCW